MLNGAGSPKSYLHQQISTCTNWVSNLNYTNSLIILTGIDTKLKMGQFKQIQYLLSDFLSHFFHYVDWTIAVVLENHEDLTETVQISIYTISAGICIYVD